MLQNIPYSSVGKFVGRDESLSQLHQLLQENDSVAIAGISGVGKTELAIQYAQQYLAHYPGGVCWLVANAEEVGLQIVKNAQAYFPNLIIPDGLNLDAQVQFCWQYWQTILDNNQKVLVVIDNVANYAEVQPYLPSELSKFKVLLVSRLSDLLPSQQQLLLDVLTPAAAIDLLASHIGQYRVKATRGKGFTVNTAQAKANQKAITKTIAQQLCEWLGYLPLSIKLVGCYLEPQPNFPLEKMLVRLQKQKVSDEFLQKDEYKLNQQAQTGIAAAFNLNWQKLDEYTQELGCLLSIFALAPIPWEQLESVLGQLYLPGALLEKLLNNSADAEAEIEKLIAMLKVNWQKARHTLLRLHLIQPTHDENYCLHQLIQDLFREKLAVFKQADTLKQAFCEVMLAVAKQIPEQPNAELIREISPAIPHIAETAKAWKDYLSNENLILPFIGLGRFYESQGLYQQASSWYEQCLSVAENYLEKDSIDVATSLNNLASLYSTQRQITKAEPLYSRALEILELKLGVEHPNTITIRENLANLFNYSSQ